MKLIDKAALVAEIERRIKTNKECMLGLRNLDYYQGKVDALNDTISFLDTLEVKEVDLEKAIDDYIYTHDGRKRLALELDWKCCNLTLKGGDEIIKFAKHFFELGIKSKSSYVSTPNIDDTLKEMGIDPDSKEADIYREAIYKIYDRLKTQKGEKV